MIFFLQVTALLCLAKEHNWSDDSSDDLLTVKPPHLLALLYLSGLSKSIFLWFLGYFFVKGHFSPRDGRIAGPGQGIPARGAAAGL
jgi:hypothetical protein